MSNGAAGDMSNRQYRQNNDWNELNRVSQGIARQMADLAETIDLNIKPVRYQTVEYQVSYQRDKKALQGILETLQANLEKETSFDGKKWLYSEIAGYEYKLQNLAIDVCLNTEVIRLGDLELIIVPCELASNLGLQLKRSSNAKVCIVWGYANGSAGYIVEASEFNGGHDGILTDLKRGQAEEYIGKVIQKMF
ncbi:hypothetical protein SDC9_154792 [bioreactor metagenome]|uniref:Uncharacterized protein n=1 Tax=bioreactor metagenome TaxID=1076179 RepID=A0A645F1Z1_9ZZZZ